MISKRDILNQIDSKKRELARLEVALRNTPEGHMSKLRKYLDSRINDDRVRYTLIDSITDETCGVLFRPYVTIGSITRSVRLEWLIENVFNTPTYVIKSAYGTEDGLVLEVHEN